MCGEMGCVGRWQHYCRSRFVNFRDWGLEQKLSILIFLVVSPSETVPRGEFCRGSETEHKGKQEVKSSKKWKREKNNAPDSISITIDGCSKIGPRLRIH